ncbi:GOLPH3/VPS74 family protein [Nocardiopsis trehalosi]|uniref:GOLPH3/VPS74 family protein n=1 Tax=Nocardiopsis trehalosi TaxID=109329 RepID=UPI000830CEEB|nr:GPP34 family phosphoprotein [Nocardiopsis trehalosi]
MTAAILAEDLLLLTYDPETGRPAADGTRVKCGLAGALVADLALAGRVRIDKDVLHPADAPAPVRDPDLDGLARRISAERRPRKVKWWVQKTATEKLRRAMLDRAVERGVLVHQKGRVLGVFPSNDYRPARPAARPELVDRLRGALAGGHNVDPRFVALLAIAAAMRVDKALFPDLGARDRRRMVKEAVARDDIGRAVRTVIQSIEAATVNAISSGGDGGGGDGGGGGS